MNNPTLRLGLYILILLCGLVGPFLFKLRTNGIFACPADGYADSHYLAYCQVPGYGDYDHGAFWFGLEPDIQQFAADATVLFLGNSRMQFAFSSRETDRWFATPPVRYYLMGFSFTENIQFATPLLAKLRPKAKVYVINVDRFFEDRETEVGKAVLRESDALARTKEKRFWQALHQPICVAVPALCGTEASFYRYRETGAWQMRGIRLWGAKPVAVGVPSEVDRWERYITLGKQFLAALPVDQRCVIFTIAPSHGTKLEEAETIVRGLGSDLVVPQVDNLMTFDGSHLDRPSAERWSHAFFEAAGPRIRACLQEGQAFSHPAKAWPRS